MADTDVHSPMVKPAESSVPIPEPEAPAGHVTQPAVVAREEFQIEERSEVRERDKWSFNIEFILACLSYVVVFSNLWRLPSLMYRHGGVVFLIPYIFLSLLFGVPLFYMETCLGQFWGKGPFHIFKICPILRGVGVAMMIVNFFIVMYTNPFMPWSAYYAVVSLFSDLPWSNCYNAWNTPNCGTSTNSSFAVVSPAQEFFNNEAFRLSEGINDLGLPKWEFVLGMFIATGLMFAALFWGVKLLGKVLFVSLGLPLLIMVVLCIRGATLPGGTEGIQYFLYPLVPKLLRIEPYRDALYQALTTVGSSAGVYHTLASYNKFNAPCLRNAFIIMILSISVGLLSGVTFMSFQGALALRLNVPMDHVVSTGFGLTYVTMPDILSTLPVAHLWCFLFFAMFFLFSFSCQIVSIEVFITAIMDMVPRPSKKMRIIVTAVVCSVFFVLTLPFLTQGGLYLMTFFDWFSTMTCFWLFCAIECIIVAGMYGLDQFSEDIRMMTGLRPPIVYKFIWTFLIPLVSFVGYAVSMAGFYPIAYGDYIYPSYINSVGIFFSYLPLGAIPAFAIFWCVRSWRSNGPLEPDTDLRPATDQWMEYDLKQRKMERSVCSNLKAVFKI